MKRMGKISWILIFSGCALLHAQTASDQPASHPAADYSGMYSFLKDGEFVQITVEDGGRVTGFISRYGDGDRGTFIVQFFKQGQLDGARLTFITQTVHAVGTNSRVSSREEVERLAPTRLTTSSKGR
jgi:hypothetical protein